MPLPAHVIPQQAERLRFPAWEGCLVSALNGDSASLETIMACAEPPLVDRLHRLGPAIFLRLRRAGVIQSEAPAWRSSFLRTAVTHLAIQATLRRVSEALGAADVAWAPIKGGDLCTRVYDQPEERPMVDLDVLISHKNYLVAREALEQRGFTSLECGKSGDQFVLDEGHCWHARSPDGMLLELHTRLWGWVPEGIAEDALASSTPDPRLGHTGRRIPLLHAFVIAALHAWSIPTPRPLLCWWDLARIVQVAGSRLPEAVIETAGRYGIQLPVGLAAAQTAGLWRLPECERMASVLLSDLRWAETSAARRAFSRGTDALPLAGLCLARLLSRRPSRQGWNTVRRRLWAHAGIVEQSTPAEWPWAIRRAVHLLRGIRLMPSPHPHARSVNEKTTRQAVA